MKSQIVGWSRPLSASKRPRSSERVAWPSRRCSSAETSDPSGGSLQLAVRAAGARQGGRRGLHGQADVRVVDALRLVACDHLGHKWTQDVTGYWTHLPAVVLATLGSLAKNPAGRGERAGDRTPNLGIKSPLL